MKNIQLGIFESIFLTKIKIKNTLFLQVPGKLLNFIWKKKNI